MIVKSIFLAPTLIVFHSVLCCLSPVTAAALPSTSRSATAAYYVDRGNDSFSKGEYLCAIASRNQ